MSENNEKKNKKIAKMSLTELDAASKKAKDSGNLQTTSKYLQHIEQRKEELKARGK
ncbi:MAG TPA: hypothetical protein PL048_06035 [Leptospiraceae bacterium]|nr:hypothetical protein [Leptospiraceae bacterium]HMY65486.1 hypothetical protein [Leptospiraceae bacterium]HMZ58313.1 hypothetical protein [Leptospiraceae bacterium]HNF12227.1 hypothetical protein [Leptospiraceae bacterium]HNF23276.1 hypothetical protein [Leptospiraceae bacterium]